MNPHFTRIDATAFREGRSSAGVALARAYFDALDRVVAAYPGHLQAAFDSRLTGSGRSEAVERAKRDFTIFSTLRDEFWKLLNIEIPFQNPLDRLAVAYAKDLLHTNNNTLTPFWVYGQLAFIDAVPPALPELLGQLAPYAAVTTALTADYRTMTERETPPGPVQFDALPHTARLCARIAPMLHPVRLVFSSVSTDAPIVADPFQFDIFVLDTVKNADTAMKGMGDITVTVDREVLTLEQVDRLRVAGPRTHMMPGGDGYIRVAITDTAGKFPAEVADAVLHGLKQSTKKGGGHGLHHAFAFACATRAFLSFDIRDEGTTVALYVPRRGARAADNSDRIAA